jgi:hypothetical protein
VRQLNDPNEISLDSERECGTTHCAQTLDDDHKHRNECSFPILVTEMPTHVRGKGAENDATKMQKMRHTSAMPVFCSGQQALHERYTKQREEQIDEIFPELDAGQQPRMHGLLEMKAGCFKAIGCKDSQAYKLKLLKGYEYCSGYNMQQISNGSHCVKTARGGNRESCGVKEKPRLTATYPKLYVKTVAAWDTFQHFLLDKLTFLIAGWQQTMHDPEVHFMALMDQRDLELVKFLGIPADRIVPFHSKQQYCASKVMYVDTELPGKYGRISELRYPRPPEMFLNSARFMQQRIIQQMEWSEPPPRDLIVWLARGSGRQQAKGTDVANQVAFSTPHISSQFGQF